MSNLNDYEDEEIITMKNSLIQIRIKKGIFQWILTFAYEFDDIKVLVKGNRVKFKFVAI
jgi:hypothetical protein